MESKHLYVVCTAIILFHNQFGYADNTVISQGPMQGIDLLRQDGDACRPWERLYRGESKLTDIVKIVQEAEALEFLFNSSKWEFPGDSKSTLVQNISTNLLKFPKLINFGRKSTFTSALGVFGGVWSLLADSFNVNASKTAGDIIRSAMHEGMNSTQADLAEKYEELNVSRAESDVIKESMSLLEV